MKAASQAVLKQSERDVSWGSHTIIEQLISSLVSFSSRASATTVRKNSPAKSYPSASRGEEPTAKRKTEEESVQPDEDRCSSAALAAGPCG
jgi:hypothetical protein